VIRQGENEGGKRLGWGGEGRGNTKEEQEQEATLTKIFLHARERHKKQKIDHTPKGFRIRASTKQKKHRNNSTKKVNTKAVKWDRGK
jgi:hypothetical protein